MVSVRTVQSSREEKNNRIEELATLYKSKKIENLEIYQEIIKLLSEPEVVFKKRTRKFKNIVFNRAEEFRSTFQDKKIVEYKGNFLHKIRTIILTFLQKGLFFALSARYVQVASLDLFNRVRSGDGKALHPLQEKNIKKYETFYLDKQFFNIQPPSNEKAGKFYLFHSINKRASIDKRAIFISKMVWDDEFNSYIRETNGVQIDAQSGQVTIQNETFASLEEAKGYYQKEYQDAELVLKNKKK